MVSHLTVWLKLRSILLHPASWGWVIRLLLIGVFAWLAARHWHPHYGFTRMVQCDVAAASTMLPSLRDARLYVHPDPGSYDGFQYAQIATSPGLTDPALRTAIDDLGYRARRILLSAFAWLLAWGDPAKALQVYAALNVFAWFALAFVLWELFPADDWRGTLAWIGTAFATGTLLSVRLALTDLVSLLFVAVSLQQLERGRRVWSGGLLGFAALARETALLGVAALLPERRVTRRSISSSALAIAVAILPLALWLAYVWHKAGSSGAGLRNFELPLFGWIHKAGDLLHAWTAEPNRPLVITTALSFVALAVQALFLAFNLWQYSPWWRMGAAFAGLMILLGPAVWGDDLPGAAFRVLLPLGLAFNVIAVRQKAALWILVLGNLSVGGGILSLYLVPHDAHEVAAGRVRAGSYVVHSSESWYPAEGRSNDTWAWCPQVGTLHLDTFPRSHAARRFHLAFRGFTPCDLHVSSAGRDLWHGIATETIEWITVEAEPDAQGTYVLEVRSEQAPGRENPNAGGRPLGFALCGVRLE
ncbi:MAG: glycosyltransferase family 87 protein [Opitutus sp.]